MSGYHFEQDDAGLVGLCLIGNWMPDMEMALKDGKYDYIRLQQIYDWLPYWPHLQGYQNSIRSVQLYHATVLPGFETLTNLEAVSIDVVPKPPPNLALFKKLKGVNLYWHKSYGPTLKALPELVGAAFYGYSEKNCQVLGEVSALRRLSLTRGRIVSLDGLQTPSIEKLELAYLRNLSDIDSASRLRLLQSLRIENCPSILDISPIVGLHKLRELFVVASARQAKQRNVTWLANMTDLERVFLHDFPVEEPPDWALILQLPRLQMVGLDVPLGYCISDSELHEAATGVGKRLLKIERIGAKRAPAIRLTVAVH